MQTTLDSRSTVRQVLTDHPQTVRVFLTLKTDCVGCHLDRFCMLTEVAAAYDLPLDDLLQALRESIRISPKRGEAL